jgi:phage terminase large subunit-like protein
MSDNARILAGGIEALEELARRKKERLAWEWWENEWKRPGDYAAYPTQRKMLTCGAKIAAMFGGNQVGKSRALLHNDVYDLTGIYPESWTGPRFNHPVDMWILGETNESTRDSLQKVLLGPDLDNPGVGGLIPPKYIKKLTKRHNIPGAADTATIRWIGGGESRVTFKSYVMGEDALSSWTGHVVHGDEEMPKSLFIELNLRLSNAMENGYAQFRMSFTPEHGWSDTVDMLLNEENPDIKCFFLGALEAKHLGKGHIERQTRLLKDDPEALAARLEGRPTRRHGAIFKNVDWEGTMCPDFEIPSGWAHLGSLDPGFDHPTAIIAAAVDRNSNSIFVYRCNKESGKKYYHHAKIMRQWDVFFTHDPAANQTEKGRGEKLTELYLDELQPNWKDVAPYDRILFKADNSVQAGNDLVESRLQNGTIYFMESCRPVMEQMKAYHYDDKGRIYKKDDDYCDTVRYLCMEISKARPKVGSTPLWAQFVQGPTTSLAGY